MTPAAPIVISTIGMPSLFPMRLDDLESHHADRLFSPCRPVAQCQVYRVSFACLVRADNCANVFCFRSQACYSLYPTTTTLAGIAECAAPHSSAQSSSKVPVLVGVNQT